LAVFSGWVIAVLATAAVVFRLNRHLARLKISG
jgi:hypothetical protein